MMEKGGYSAVPRMRLIWNFMIWHRSMWLIGIHVTINPNSFQDLHTVDLEEFKHGGTNITAFRLVDPEKPEIQKVIQDWIYGEKRYNRELDMGQNSNKVRFISLGKLTIIGTIGNRLPYKGEAAPGYGVILKSFILPTPIFRSQSSSRT